MVASLRGKASYSIPWCDANQSRHLHLTKVRKTTLMWNCWVSQVKLHSFMLMAFKRARAPHGSNKASKHTGAVRRRLFHRRCAAKVNFVWGVSEPIWTLPGRKGLSYTHRYTSKLCEIQKCSGAASYSINRQAKLNSDFHPGLESQGASHAPSALFGDVPTVRPQNSRLGRCCRCSKIMP